MKDSRKDAKERIKNIFFVYYFNLLRRNESVLATESYRGFCNEK